MPASRLEISLLDSSWDTPARPSRPARPPRRPSSRMSTIDRSWSEPHGVPVVAPEALATGTAAHAAAGLADAEPRRFLGIPVVAPRPALRADAAAGRSDHDATSLVDPLPAPPRPGAHDRSAPRAAAIPDEHTARSRQRRSDRHRRHIAILAGAIAGIVLACGVMVLSTRAPDHAAAAPPPPPQRQWPRTDVPVAAPAAAPVASAKPWRASTAAPKKPAAAPKRTAAKQPASAKPAPAKLAPAAKPAAAKPAAAKPAAAKPAPAKPAVAKPAVAKPAAAKPAATKPAAAKRAGADPGQQARRQPDRPSAAATSSVAHAALSLSRVV